MELWIYWMYFTIKFFSVSFAVDEKKVLWWKTFPFGHHTLAFLSSFLNILKKYVLILNKYNHE